MSEIKRTQYSVYEIDGLKVRRLSGANDPTPYQGADGEWREAQEIELLTDGRLAFRWDDTRYTITSPVQA